MDITKLSWNEQKELAISPNTPENTLMKLVHKDVNEGIRYYVTVNPHTSGDVLREMSEDPAGIIRWSVAENPNTPEDVLRKLITDVDTLVRTAVAENIKSSSNILVAVLEHEKTVKTPSDFVIEALYANHKLPAFAKRIIETLFGEMI